MDKKIFEPILDKNETIIKVFKPNKTKLFWSSLLATFFISFFVVLWAVFAIGLGGGFENSWLIAIIAFLGFQAIILLIAIGFTSMYYNKLFYAYSNKRIIIRTGIFGVDYKSLDMSMIGAVNVNVSLLDKMLGKNTGSIKFGSMASPIVASGNNGGVNPYHFSNILTPYETYRELKDVIDEYKELKAKKN